MGHDVPEIDHAVADVDASIEEVDEIGMADARFGPGVNDGGEIAGEVVEYIEGRESAERAAETVAGDEDFFEAGGFARDERGESGADAFANGFIHDEKALVDGAAAGNGTVGSGSEVEIVEPIPEILGAAERDDQAVVGGVEADPAEMLVGLGCAAWPGRPRRWPCWRR